MTDKMTFRKWLQERYNQKERNKLYKEIRLFIEFPIWELIIGIFVTVFSYLWWTLPLVIGIPMSILQIIFGILIMLHSAYRHDNYIYQY